MNVCVGGEGGGGRGVEGGGVAVKMTKNRNAAHSKNIFKKSDGRIPGSERSKQICIATASRLDGININLLFQQKAP